MAFSLAASAVSLARSVAVSAKVLDGVSPTKGHNILIIISVEYLHTPVVLQKLCYPSKVVKSCELHYKHNIALCDSTGISFQKL